MRAGTYTEAVTLADAVFPRVQTDSRIAALARDLALMLGFAGFVALCAQIAVRLPWTTVPITGQTFAVLVTGGALGAWRGAGSLSIYMLVGMIGMPVFAPGGAEVTGNWDVHPILPWDGTHALVWDISSGGYIVGFILAAALVGFLAERQWDRKPWVHLGMFLGNVALYVPGILWLAYLIQTDWIHPAAGKPLGDLIAGSGTWGKAVEGGLYPFIVGDLMKLFLASLTLPAAWSLVARFKGTNGRAADGAGSR
ncbi:MAG TPA: biotin transporter BioY [Dehalococcoidia bacterium]|nr:biotin transporter BioY [Dehalococcoidia bacterium]